MKDCREVQELGNMIQLRFCIKAQVLFKAPCYFKHMPKVLNKGHGGNDADTANSRDMRKSYHMLRKGVIILSGNRQ